MKLMEFWVEHIDYNDEVLVDCVYRIYERVERNGEIYLQNQIFEDAECLEDAKIPELVYTVVEESRMEEAGGDMLPAVPSIDSGEEKARIQDKQTKPGRKGIKGILEGKRSRSQRLREDYRQAKRQEMAGYDYAVAEKHPL